MTVLARMFWRDMLKTRIFPPPDRWCSGGLALFPAEKWDSMTWEMCKVQR